MNFTIVMIVMYIHQFSLVPLSTLPAAVTCAHLRVFSVCSVTHLPAWLTQAALLEADSEPQGKHIFKHVEPSAGTGGVARA